MRRYSKHLIVLLNISFFAFASLKATTSEEVTAYAGKDTSICTSVAKLNAEVPLLGTGQWTIVPGMGGATIADNSNPNTMVGGLRMGINKFVWTVTYYTSIARDTVIITNNSPSKANAGNDQIIIGSIAHMNATPPAIGIGEWSILNGSAEFKEVNDPFAMASGLMNGLNEFKWTVHNFGCTSSDSVIIMNGQMKTADAGFDQAICFDETVLGANDPEEGIGYWSVVSGAGSFKDIYNPNTVVRYISQEKNVYRWTIQYANYISIDTVIITNNRPTTANAGKDILIETNEYILNANTPMIGIGQWTLLSGGCEFENINDPNTNITGLNPEKNILRWTISNNSCESYDDVVVTVDMATNTQLLSSECVVSVINSMDSEIIIKVDGNCKVKNWELVSLSGLKICGEYCCNLSQFAIKKETNLSGLYLILITYENGTTEVKKVVI
ncbi:MAG: hypothetical protein KBH01_01030 [Breznakibacter sp.]|nr:hypothetical protein [Breznakibacter sp.]